MTAPIFFIPVFQERIWGGTHLREVFGYEIPSETTGECWAISAHPNGQSIVKDGIYKGLTLGELWDKHRELFGNAKGDVFPLLTKILDANHDLSVQVHPDDTYAQDFENGELGKTECWYIIDCKENAEIIYGHHVKTKEELIAKISGGQWDALLRRVKIKPGDFFYVPSGTIHALCAGTLVLETQQSSDTTYRLYDYDRRDDKGNLRELHLEKAIDVIRVPHFDMECQPQTTMVEGREIIAYVQSEFFSVYKWSMHGETSIKQTEPFLIASVLTGEGTIVTEEHSYPFKKGDHFILPANFGSATIIGRSEWIVSHV
ncbi:mannose-6-phosphate isomerase, class I [Fodinisporobacter ferrooxydans]|uniref:Mannose-6-phosphate isomerase n=1 Tax=Fodinisporobacter ferrooxydans TaxID=2901836 RepID=A0ABY4CQS6_9BACL|nr:mannose-6-phosphate isomerase, class I [Alicyclobacillaceae bacterium MYW30-H2]